MFSGAHFYLPIHFTPRLTKYNLRDSGLNIVQPPYNGLVMHNSHLYMTAHMWNQLPIVTKSQILEHFSIILCSPEQPPPPPLFGKKNEINIFK